MKIPLCLAACLLTIVTALPAAESQFEIEARFEGFSLSSLLEVPPGAEPGSSEDGVLAAPRVTTKAGQRATIEIIQEIAVPGGTMDGKSAVNGGVILTVLPNFKDGKIRLEGNSTVRRRLDPGDKQPLGAISFSTRETFFNGEVSDGKPFVIRIGDGAKDPSKVTLTVTRVEPAAPTGHTGVPKYRFYAIEPSPEEAKKPIYHALGILPPTAPFANPAADRADTFMHDSLRDGQYVVGGVFESDARTQPGGETLFPQIKDALREIPAAELPIKVSTVLGSDGSTLDMKIDATPAAARVVSTSVSAHWGSDILLVQADAGSATGRRGLLIHQE